MIFYFQRLLALVSVVVFSFSACTSPQIGNRPSTVISVEQEKHWDESLEGALSGAYKGWNEPRATQIIEKIVKKLLAADAQLSSSISAVNVKTFRTEKVYVQAGIFDHLYVSKGALMTLKYESELAFLLARELVVLKSTAIKSQLMAHEGNQADYLYGNWFVPGGLFALPPQKQLAFDREAIQLLYKAHYDCRGAAILLQRWNDLSKKPTFSFEQAKILPPLKDRLQEVRDEIAKLSPLRNPIVTSRDFESFLTWLASQAKGKVNAGRTAIN